MERALLSFLVEVLPLLVLVLGLLFAGMSGFHVYSHSERKWTAYIGGALVILGVCGIIWPVFIFVYLILAVLGLVSFAGVGLYRTFG